MADLLRSALAALERESEVHAVLLPRALGDRYAGLELDGEALRVRGGGARLDLQSGTSKGEVRAYLSLDTLLALIEERLPLAQALRQRELRVFGSIDDLRYASRACHVLMHGLVRAPSGPSLLARLRLLQTNRRTAS